MESQVKPLVLVSDSGIEVTIPEHLRREVEDMLLYDCQACLNKLIEQLTQDNNGM